MKNQKIPINTPMQLEAGDQHLGGFSIPAYNKFTRNTPQSVQQVQGNQEVEKIIQQLRALLNRAHNAALIPSIQETLLREFSHVFEDDTSLWNKTKNWASRLAIKANVGITVILAVKEMWDEIQAIPEDTPPNVRDIQIRQIVATVIGQYGANAVGGALGAIVGSPAGLLGTITGGIGGYLATDIYFGDDIEEIVDNIIKHLYPIAHSQIKKPEDSTGVSSGVTNLIKEFQRELDVAETGEIDDRTVRAMQQDLIELGAQNITVSGNVDMPTLVAIKKYYF